MQAESLTLGKFQFALSFISIVLVFGFTTASAEVAQLPAHNPQVCIGFSPTANKWGKPADGMCAENQVISELSFSRQPRTNRFGDIELGVTCCQLPASDILESAIVFSASSCPNDFVATGSEVSHKGSEMEKRLRCQKINTVRYRLGPTTKGVYWGTGFTLIYHPWRVMRGNLPSAFRYSVGRLTRHKWLEHGCLGIPLGSLLTAKNYRFCWGLEFRQLLFRGQPGDPPDHTPVSMYPKCLFLDDKLSPEAQCRK